MKTDITAKIYKKAFGVDLDDKDVNKHVKAVIIMQILHAKSMQGMSCYVFYALGGKSLPARLSIKPFHGGFMSNMVSSYLSPTPPEDAVTLSCGNPFRHPSANGIMGL